MILRCFQQGTIETTDWDNMQLESLGGAPGHKKKLLGGNNGGKKRSALAGGAQFESFEDRERREKRARRFNNEQAAFQSQEREAMENAMASSSLGARLGGFDPNRLAPHNPIPFSGARGGGWTGSSSPSLAFGDAEVADPVSAFPCISTLDPAETSFECRMSSTGMRTLLWACQRSWKSHTCASPRPLTQRRCGRCPR